jgi:hypothetical protein
MQGCAEQRGRQQESHRVILGSAVPGVGAVRAGSAAIGPAGRSRTIPAMSDKTLLLVDGSSYLYRAFHALPDLRSPSGFPTGRSAASSR